MESFRHYNCPNCSEQILDFSKNCPRCGQLLLSDSQLEALRSWLYENTQVKDDHTIKAKSKELPISVNTIKIPRSKKFIGLDPIVWPLLKGGVRSFITHGFVFIGLILLYIALLTSVVGLVSLLDKEIEILFPGFAPLQIIVGGGLNFLLAGLIAVIGQDFAFKRTLEKGELGISFEFTGSSMSLYIRVVGMVGLLLVYFIMWAAFFHLPVLLDERVWMLSGGSPNIIYRFIFMIILFIIMIIIQIIIFFVAIKGVYFVFQLDPSLVPDDAIEGILIFVGLSYGILIIFLRLFPVFGQEIVSIITFLIPGAVLVPIFGFAMAHLKTASSYSLTMETEDD